jgi:MFS family permease
VLALLALTGAIDVAWIIALNIMQGLINAFDMPARQAFVVEMITDREDLPNAIALNSSMVNVARLLGPSIAAVLIALVGEGLCFAIDSASYVAVIASLVAMSVPARAGQAKTGRVWAQMREGLAYVVRSVPIRAVLLLLALVSLMGVPYTVLMPVMATEVLHGGVNTLGVLMAASGLGALCGALYLASRRSVLGLGRIIAGTAATFGLGLAAFSRSHVLWLSLVLMPIAGAAMMIQMAASNTILQTIVDEDKRGRVMSFYSMAFFGTVPLGSLLAGSLAARIGAPNTILFGGLCCVAGAALFLRELPDLRRAMRPIYVRLGILPESADSANPAPNVELPPD